MVSSGSDDLKNPVSAKKSKTPNRKKINSNFQITEKTEAMATKLKQSVFELTREECQHPETNKHQRSANKLSLGDMSKMNSCDNNLLVKNGPESPSILSVNPHAIPTVSAKMTLN